ncbi:NgoBV family restriction endonuclease [Nitrosomonadales bacterium]|nr:NgoBV family restriction endonuclease [Nitrosomonadales bacterium]
MITSQAYHPESQKAYKLLVQNITSLSGGTIFNLGGHSIQVEKKDGIGGLIEEWFGFWAQKQNLNIFNPNSSQEFPDYFAGKLNDGYLEIKTFNHDASPAFDVANFDGYCRSLSENPFRLFADYLIFSYELDKSVLKIQKIWLKKIWEICSGTGLYPLKTQIKQGVIVNIRPGSFHSDRNQFPLFTNPRDFTNALYETEYQYNNKTNFKNDFEKKLQEHKILI